MQNWQILVAFALVGFPQVAQAYEDTFFSKFVLSGAQMSQDEIGRAHV